jgi:hypothetical protein
MEVSGTKEIPADWEKYRMEYNKKICQHGKRGEIF